MPPGPRIRTSSLLLLTGGSWTVPNLTTHSDDSALNGGFVSTKPANCGFRRARFLALGLARGRYEPLTDISPMSSGAALTLPPKGTQRLVEPTAWTALSIETRSLAIVISRAGAPSSPPSIRRPVAPTEKVPDTGFTPEWRPATSVT